MANVNNQYSKFPFGAPVQTTITGSASLSLFNDLTIAEGTLSSAVALAISASASLPIGSQFQVIAFATVTQSLSFTGDIFAATITVGQGKTASQGFLYDGTKFYPMGSSVQI